MTNPLRHYSTVDVVIDNVDKFLRTIHDIHFTKRPTPTSAPTSLTLPQQQLSAKLMRVNHCGEVCAQALYQGQALSARNNSVQAQLRTAASEEEDHLAWCHERILELNSHTSYLNPLWYAGSFMIGLLAGYAGDAWSLGFLMETERQVVVHLAQHLQKLPDADLSSRVILMQMQHDESCHATTALDAGAKELPESIKMMMKYFSRVMTTVAYWI